jgi:hypothetical protein
VYHSSNIINRKRIFGRLYTHREMDSAINDEYRQECAFRIRWRASGARYVIIVSEYVAIYTDWATRVTTGAMDMARVPGMRKDRDETGDKDGGSLVCTRLV